MAEEIWRFRHHAMATAWVVGVVGEDRETAAWAAREAFAMVDRLEEDLSRFQPVSYVSQIARLPRGGRLRVSQETYECLLLAKAVWSETGGAFDITVRDGAEALPSRLEWVSRMEGFGLYEGHEIGVRAGGLALDLGGIGKGFAIDEITRLFHEEDIENALIDAGGSTLFGMGNAPDSTEGWPVSLGERHGLVALADRAMSASGFEVKGRHVMDPRTGRPVDTERQRAWVMAGSAALADALSTAALVMTEAEIAALSEAHPEITIMVA